MVVVVAQAAEVIKRNHLKVRSRQCSRELRLNNLQNPLACLLLKANSKRKLSALLSLLW